MDDLITLQGVGYTYSQEWRLEKARSISNWVVTNRTAFPLHVQQALTYLSNIAGTTIPEGNRDVAQHPNAFELIRTNRETLIAYEQGLRRRLTGLKDK